MLSIILSLALACTPRSQKTVVVNKQSTVSSAVETPSAKATQPIRIQFMLVNEEAMKQRQQLQQAIDKIKISSDFAEKDFLDDMKLSNHLQQTHSDLVAKDSIVLWEYTINPTTKKRERLQDGFYVLTNKVFLQNEDIQKAHVDFNSFNEPYVSISFTQNGKQVLAQITADNIGNRLAIVIAGEVRSAPFVREKIASGVVAVETGIEDQQEALMEAKMLAFMINEK